MLQAPRQLPVFSPTMPWLVQQLKSVELTGASLTQYDHSDRAATSVHHT